MLSTCSNIYSKCERLQNQTQTHVDAEYVKERKRWQPPFPIHPSLTAAENWDGNILLATMSKILTELSISSKWDCTLSEQFKLAPHDWGCLTCFTLKEIWGLQLICTRALWLEITVASVCTNQWLAEGRSYLHSKLRLCHSLCPNM